jgi:hypothetical protein
MKAKLHKMESGYILSLNGDIDDPVKAIESILEIMEKKIS